MDLTLRAFYCPCCGARLDPPSLRLVECAYCDAKLAADPEQISEQQPLLGDGLSQLRQARQGRFEMSHLYQDVGPASDEHLEFRPLGEHHCGVVYLRLCDKDGHNVAGQLPVEAVWESLARFKDPGLAGYTALEQLCQQAQGFRHFLECAILLFDDRRSRLKLYCAGCRDSLYWLSQEQARVQAVGGHQAALERKMLLQQADHFSCAAPIDLVAYDVVMLVSAGYTGRGGGSYCSGTHALTQELNTSLGEEPLRLVTLAKNAFWSRRSPAAYEIPPAGPLHVVALQARPSQVSESVPAGTPLQSFASPSFELACSAHPDDYLEVLPLHGQRTAWVWARNGGLPFSAEQASLLRQHILEVLDRPDHGDNENPREAGRQAQQRVNLTQLIIFLLLDRYQRVKYYRFGCSHPTYLAPRWGQNSHSMQCFDGGGEVSVSSGARLLILPGLEKEAEPMTALDLANLWPGGKASNLYACLSRLWTTPPCQEALEKVMQAVASDRIECSWAFLVTSKGED